MGRGTPKIDTFKTVKNDVNFSQVENEKFWPRKNGGRFFKNFEKMSIFKKNWVLIGPYWSSINVTTLEGGDYGPFFCSRYPGNRMG